MPLIVLFGASLLTEAGLPDVQDRIAEVQTALNRANLPFGARKVHPMKLDTYEFKMDKKDYNVYWDVRKGLIPIVGGARETGDHQILFTRLGRHCAIAQLPRRKSLSCLSSGVHSLRAWILQSCRSRVHGAVSISSDMVSPLIPHKWRESCVNSYDSKGAT